MFDQTFPLVVIFLLGVGLKKLGILHKHDGRVIGQLLMHVLIPAAIVNAVARAVIAPGLLLVVVAGFLVQVLLFLLGWLLAPMLGLSGKQRGAFLVAFPTMECGTIGVATMTVAFGSVGLTNIALFDLGTAVLGSFAVPFLASWFGQQVQPEHQMATSGTSGSFLMALKDVMKTPLLWAFVLGVLLNVFHIHVVLLSNVLTTITDSLLFLVIFFIGLECDWSNSSLSLPGLAMYLKLCAGITVGLLVSLVLGLGGIERIAVVLAASLPISLLTVPLANQHRLDGPFLAQQLSLALPISLITSWCLTMAPH